MKPVMDRYNQIYQNRMGFTDMVKSGTYSNKYSIGDLVIKFPLKPKDRVVPDKINPSETNRKFYWE